MQAAAIAIDTEHASSVWNWKYFENDARPGLILQSDGALSQETVDRLKNQWETKYK